MMFAQFAKKMKVDKWKPRITKLQNHLGWKGHNNTESSYTPDNAKSTIKSRPEAQAF